MVSDRAIPVASVHAFVAPFSIFVVAVIVVSTITLYLLVKYWVRFMKTEREGFKFKSFMVELIMAKLLDKGTDFSDYPEALQSFFTYLATSNLNELIIFEDYYKASTAPSFTERVRIIDPVNSKNNAAKLYTRMQADAIVEAAIDAGDAIDAALSATTKEKTVYYWQKVFGSTFQI